MASKKKNKGFSKDFDHDVEIDKIESSLDLQSVHLSQGKGVKGSVSTGSLALDLNTGGGWPPGRFCILYGLEASGKCLTKNSYVFSTRGIMSIKDYVGDVPYEVPRVRNDVIESSIGLNNVSHVFRRKVNETVKIKLSSGIIEECTPEHPWYVIDKVSGVIIEKMAKDIKNNDLLLMKSGSDLWASSYLRCVDISDSVFVNANYIDERLARIMGVLVAYGCTSKNLYGEKGRIGFSVHKKLNKKILRLFLNDFEDYFGESLNVLKPKVNDGSIILQCFNKDICSFLMGCGLKFVGSRNKEIPFTILRSPKSVVMSFLKSYFSCDYANEGIASKKLAKHLHLVLLNLGIKSVLRSKGIYTTICFGSDLKLFESIFLSETYYNKYGKLIGDISRGSSNNTYNYGRDSQDYNSFNWLTNILDIEKKKHPGYKGGYYTVKGKKKKLKLFYDKNITRRFLSEDIDFLYSLRLLVPEAYSTVSFMLKNKLFPVKVVAKKTVTKNKVVYDMTVPYKADFLADGVVSHNSTLLYNAMPNSALRGIPTRMGDAEGSTDPAYLSNIIGRYGLSLTDMFGAKDKKGKYVVRPLIRYYQPTTGESWFRLMSRRLDMLPDRVQKSIKGKIEWVDIYPNGEEVVRGDGNIQEIWFMDSLPAFLPENIERDDEKTAMATQARMYSQEMPRIMSKMSKKRVTLIATNQIRLRPGVSFGNPEYLPCGEAVKFYSSLRIRVGTVSFSNKDYWVKNEASQTQEEKSWDGKGTDEYRLIKVSIPKNKMFSPYKTTMMRIWFKAADGMGYGIDPVYDTAQYLKETGQLVKLSSAKGYHIKMVSPIKINKTVKWSKFKEMVMNPKFKNKLRKACFKQIRTGKAFDLYFNSQVEV